MSEMNYQEVYENFADFRGFRQFNDTVWEKIEALNPNFRVPHDHFDISIKREGTPQSKQLKVILSVKDQKEIKEKYTPNSHEIEFNINDFDVAEYIREMNFPSTVKLTIDEFQNNLGRVKGFITNTLQGNYGNSYFFVEHKTNNYLKALVFFDQQVMNLSWLGNYYEMVNKLEDTTLRAGMHADETMANLLTKREWDVNRVNEMLNAPEGKDQLSKEHYEIKNGSSTALNADHWLDNDDVKKYITHVVWIYSDEELVVKDITSDITNKDLTFERSDLTQ